MCKKVMHRDNEAPIQGILDFIEVRRGRQTSRACKTKMYNIYVFKRDV